MRRKLGPPAALVMAAMAALISAGCSNGSANNGNPGADSSTGAGNGAVTGAGSSGGSKNATRHEKAVRFAECMRNNGVSAFPDPDASGDLTIDGVVNGSSVDPSGATWKQAISACKNLEPPAFTGSKATPKQMSARLEFARCIRDNGVKDFPDPTKDGPLVDTNRIPSSAKDGGMSILNAAMRKCGDIYSDELGLK